MKKLLAISWCFPPTIYPRSIQVSRLLAALASHDWHSDVVCVDPSSLRPGQLLDETLNRPAGGMVKNYQVATLEDWLPVRGMIRLIPALGVLPDPKWVWKKAALRKAMELAARNQYAGYITFGQPWTDHLVGLQIKEETRIPWVAHFSDPWADSPYVKFSTWVMQKRLEMETAVIKNADAVIFVTDQTADLVMKKYPDSWREKVHVIPHGYETIPANEIQHINPDKPLELVYSGGFYGQRSPETLLRAAAEIQNQVGYKNSFLIRFIGAMPMEHQQLSQQLGLKNCLFEGARTHSESQTACQAADVFLVIDAPSEGSSVFLPSKLVDYLAFNKPILGITPATGASADLLARLGCPAIDPNNVAGIAAQLRLLVDAHRKGELQLPANFISVARQYHIQNAAEKMNQVLLRLTRF
jgi:hypothetical protein